MTDTVVPYSKERQARGKPDKGEPTKIADKRAEKVAASPPGDLNPRELALTAISHGRNPREHAATTDKSLLESVKLHGVLQPIRVRPSGEGTFTIVAGHRRFEAAKAAKLPTIPVVVAVADDVGAFTQALVENLQREDLNPIDEAKGFQQLLEETGKSQEEVGKLVGRSQPYVANALRLLTLEPEVVEQIEAGKITTAHGKALASLDPERQKKVAAQVVNDKLTSREVEETVRQEKESQKAAIARVELQTSQGEKAVAEVAELLKANPGLTKEKLTVFVSFEHLRKALTDAGYVAKMLQQETGLTIEPAWECLCTETNVAYDDWRGMRLACVDEAHEKAWRKARDAERQKANAEIGKKVTKTRSAAASAMRSKTEGEALSLTGQRAALYLLLTSHRGYGGGEQTEAFVKRFGGAPRSGYSGDYGDVWEVVESLTVADLAKVFSELAAARIVPNVWTAMPSEVERDWKVREYLFEQKAIEREAVWGPKGQTDTSKKSERERLEKAKLAGIEAEKKASEKAVAKAEAEVVAKSEKPAKGKSQVVVDGTVVAEVSHVDAATPKDEIVH